MKKYSCDGRHRKYEEYLKYKEVAEKICNEQRGFRNKNPYLYDPIWGWPAEIAPEFDFRLTFPMFSKCKICGEYKAAWRKDIELKLLNSLVAQW